jgi:hypothetical protein
MWRPHHHSALIAILLVAGCGSPKGAPVPDAATAAPVVHADRDAVGVRCPAAIASEIERCEPARLLFDALMDDGRDSGRGLCTADDLGPGHAANNRPIVPEQFDACVESWVDYLMPKYCARAHERAKQCADGGAP